MVKVFLTLLALKDSDQVVRHNAFAIGRRCWPRDDKAEVKVLDALKILASPDRRRLEPQANEGRRIQKVRDGWMLLNGQFYEDMMRNLNRRAYKAKKQRGGREEQDAPSGREGRGLWRRTGWGRGRAADRKRRRVYRLGRVTSDQATRSKRDEAWLRAVCAGSYFGFKAPQRLY